MTSLYNSHGVYIIENTITGMVYIGKTTLSFGDRRDCHYAQLRKGYHHNTNLQSDWNKYGEEKFEFRVLEDCTSSDVDYINRREIYYINKYRQLDKAYNLADGGDSVYWEGRQLSDEAKRRIGEKNRKNMTGRKASDDTRKKMSESQRRRYENMSTKDREKFKESCLGNNAGTVWSDGRRAAYSESQHLHPHGAKYDADRVREIRRMHEVDGTSAKEIADFFDMNLTTVKYIISYKRWKHVS